MPIAKPFAPARSLTTKLVDYAALQAMATGLLLLAASDPAAAAAPASFVHGSVVAQMGKQRAILLPEAKVFLMTQGATPKPVASAVTDLSGRFVIKTFDSGAYTLCVEAAGFAPQCLRGELGLAPGSTRRVGNLGLVPARKDGMAALYGSLRLADQSNARAFHPALGIHSFASVGVTTGSGFKAQAAVNNLGEYVLPQVPSREHLDLLARVEAESLKLRLDAATALVAGNNHELNLQFENMPPRVRHVAAMAGGKPVQVAGLGQTVKLHVVAEDRDRDALQVWWTLPDGSVRGPSSDTTLDWTTPGTPGQHSVGVVVGDGRGGYVSDRITVPVGLPGVAFGGLVQDVAGNPVGGVQVEVNGRTVNTNAQGRFAFNVPATDRYVLNLRKLGLGANEAAYGPGSYVYSGGVADGRWTLRPAKVFTVDPTQPILIQHAREGKDCPRSMAEQVDWNPYLRPGLVDWQNGRGDSIPPQQWRHLKSRAALPQTLRVLAAVNPALGRYAAKTTRTELPRIQPRPCGPGIQVAIPANSLVNTSTGALPPGPVRIALSTIDMGAGNMPGDFTVQDAQGKFWSMESFGAGSVEIGDGSARYNLKSGAQATVTLPIDGTQRAGGASVAATIPFLRYNESTGRWGVDGQAQRVGSGASMAYQKKVDRFSTLNADILKQGQACVAVELDPAANFSLPLSVEVTMPPSVVNPNVVQVRQFSVDSQRSNVVFNLPLNTNIAFTPFVNGVKPDGSSGLVPTGVFVVNTGGPMNALSNPPAPNPDGTYFATSNGNPTGPCAARVTLKRQGVAGLNNGQEFLQGLYFQASNLTELAGNAAVVAAIDQGAQDYYNQADPRSLRASLNLFKSQNRFGQPQTATDIEVNAHFANSGDLGFGREMHCRKNLADDGKFDVACYVTNYGQPPANNPDQQDADAAFAHLGPEATVAMEYSRVENASGVSPTFPDNQRAVKFYVYNTNAPDSAPVRKADLDNFGERPVPQLCMACHGGNLASIPIDPANPAAGNKGAFASRADIVSMGAKFLPFDLHLYNYPAAASKASQQAAFKQLNQAMVGQVAQDMGNAALPITNLVNTWYAGNAANQNETAVVAGWDAGNPNSNAHRFYRDVFGKACRTCHVSQPFGAPAFDTKADFEALIPLVQQRVCVERIMPHAKRTHEVFWQSVGPSMPSFLQLYGSTLPGWDSSSANAQCGTSYTVGQSVPTPFTQTIFPILQSRCAGCHSVVGNANFAIAGGAAATYSSLINSTPKSGSGKYIVGGNLAGSVLYQRVSSTGSNRMPPPPSSALSAADLNAIQVWINGGANGP